MNGTELFHAMGQVSDRFVAEAEQQRLPKSTTLWPRWSSAAACLCILAAIAWTQLPRSANRETTDISEDSLSGQSVDTAPACTEVPSVILRIASTAEGGFIGTVEQLVDTDLFSVGTELRVLVAEEGTYEIPLEESYVSQDIAAAKRNWEAGMLVQVQFLSYDEASGTIVVNLIRFLEE